ncbi:MAG TPA: monovalent cation/H+ antiporter subunit D [Marinagarivorans sp.]
MSHLIILPVLLPLLTGVLLLLLPRKRRLLIHTVSLASAALLMVFTVQLLLRANGIGYEVYALGNWAPPFGIVLVLDKLSALMLALTSTLAFFSLLYTAAETGQRSGQTLHALSHFLLLGVNGAFLTGDIFNLFVFFEILLLSSYSLLLQGGGPARAKAGLHYVVLNLAGSGMFLIAVAILYGLTGTLNLADMAQRVTQVSAADAPLVAAAAVLLLLVFGLKGAVMPLYFWLPRAYASATAPVAALFAIMTKVGVYAIIRVYSLVFGDEAGELAGVALPWLWPLALLTIVFSVIGVLAARELRIQIAYLVIVSVGTLLAGVALNSEAALSATLYYLLHSTWICAALFLLADQIVRQRGSSEDRIASGPALRQGILLGSLFLVAAVSIVGLPPLSGFIGKILLLQAATGTQAVWLWSIILVASLAVLTALSRSGSTIFWRTTSETLDNAPAAGRFCLTAIFGLLALGVALVIFGDTVLEYTGALAQQIMQPQGYIDAVLGHTVKELPHE